MPGYGYGGMPMPGYGKPMGGYGYGGMPMGVPPYGMGPMGPGALGLGAMALGGMMGSPWAKPWVVGGAAGCGMVGKPMVPGVMGAHMLPMPWPGVYTSEAAIEGV
jgi:hypothetical protein